MMFQTFQTELILEPNHFLSWFGRSTGRPIWINLCSCSLVHETLKQEHPNARSEGENHRYKDASEPEVPSPMLRRGHDLLSGMILTTIDYINNCPNCVEHGKVLVLVG